MGDLAKVLLSGAVGGFLVWFIGTLWEQYLGTNRLRCHWLALSAEIMHCGKAAKSYSNRGVESPLYRLPTLCHQSSFPYVVAEGNLTEDEAAAILKFYAEVENLNRGLDQADASHRARDDDQLRRDVKRNRTKAGRLAEPDGEHYAPAINTVRSQLASIKRWHWFPLAHYFLRSE